MFIFGKLVPALCLRAVIPVQMARRGGAGEADLAPDRAEPATEPEWGVSVSARYYILPGAL